MFLDQPLEPIAKLLRRPRGSSTTRPGVTFMATVCPYILSRASRWPDRPRDTIEIEGITTVSLADLIDMKLESGSKNVLRGRTLPMSSA